MDEILKRPTLYGKLFPMHFHFKASKMFKNLLRTPKIYNIIFLIENMFKQAYPFFWMQYMDNHQPRRGHNNLLTRHFGREDMQQQLMPIGICQRCDRGNRRQLTQIVKQTQLSIRPQLVSRF